MYVLTPTKLCQLGTYEIWYLIVSFYVRVKHDFMQWFVTIVLLLSWFKPLKMPMKKSINHWEMRLFYHREWKYASKIKMWTMILILSRWFIRAWGNISAKLTCHINAILLHFMLHIHTKKHFWQCILLRTPGTMTRLINVPKTQHPEEE